LGAAPAAAVGDDESKHIQLINKEEEPVNEPRDESMEVDS